MSGSKQTTTASEKRDPWAPAQAPLKSILGSAGDVYNQRLGQQFYPGQTYAGFSPETEQGLSSMAQRASAGSPTIAGANTMIGNTLNGSYLSSGNPYFSAMTKRITDSVLPSITSQWQHAGRGTGNSEVIEAAGRGLGDSIGQLAYQNYGDERAKQMQAAGMAPGLASADYMDAERLLGVGAQREAQTQRGIDEARQRYQFEQDKQANALREYQGSVMPIAGLGGESNSTSETQRSASPLQTAMGIGVMGASLFGKGGPMAGLFGSAAGGAGNIFSQGSAADQRYVNPYSYQGYNYSAMPGRMGFGFGV